MPDTADPGIAPVTDHRTPPRGVLPRHAQIWLMLALALGILVVILFTGQPAPANRAVAGTTPLPPNADRLRDYQGQLRSMEDRARQQGLESSAAPTSTAPRDMPNQASTAAPQDPMAEERKRRDYDSLFASNLVVSRRSGPNQPVGSSGDTSGRPVGSDQGADRMPSLEETAEAVIRASGRVNQPPALPGVTPALSPVQAVSGTSTSTPGRTAAIESTGPLHRLLEGTIIDAVLTNRLDGSSASPVNALVTNPIYSHRGDHVVIPAGARVLGETKPVQGFGDTRLAVAFHRLLFPDGSTVSLEQFKGLNQVGDNGLRDKVNNHYLSTFGAAAAVGLVTGLSQYIGTARFGGGNGDRTIVVAGGVGNSTSQATSQVLNRFLNRLPTITIREGTRLKVYLTSDLELPAYTPRSALR